MGNGINNNSVNYGDGNCGFHCLEILSAVTSNVYVLGLGMEGEWGKTGRLGEDCIQL